MSSTSKDNSRYLPAHAYTWLGLLVLLITLSGIFAGYNRCRAHEHRCELNCNEDYQLPTQRERCYERCQDKAAECNKYGDDEP